MKKSDNESDTMKSATSGMMSSDVRSNQNNSRLSQDTRIRNKVNQVQQQMNTNKDNGTPG